MGCLKPLHAYKSIEKKTKNGKGKIFFNHCEAGVSVAIDIPCGQCIGCRIDRSVDWAVRCVHEASLYEDNCFITLTFDEDHFNKGYVDIDGVVRKREVSLCKMDFQKFMKRLRKRYKGRKIRYFHCGEYGSNFGRPHHHACLFNIDFKDKKIWSVRNGNRLYRSEELESLWPFGYSLIGDVTFESAAYVARYVTKKITGEKKDNYYKKVDMETGEVKEITPEYVTMSRRPGIGHEWFKRFKDDLFPKDYITHNGKRYQVPEYYNKLLGDIQPESLLSIRKKRRMKAEENKSEREIWRLRSRLMHKELMYKVYERSYEDADECI